MRIDVHNHFIPPYLVHGARENNAVDGLTTVMRDGVEFMLHRQGYTYPLAGPFWDAEAKLAHMDGLGIDISVMSIAPTMLFHWLDRDEGMAFSKATNDAMGALNEQTDGRLRGLATLPMQDPAAAADELRRCVNELGLLGAFFGSTIEKVPVSDARFAPVLQAANDLKVPIMLHPYDKLVRQREELSDYYLSNLIGIPLATTLAASKLILSGALERMPDLNVVLMHAGGYLPYQIGRLDHGYNVRAETKEFISQPPSTFLDRFYFDVITHHPQRLGSLIEWVGADHVVIGTDIPFDMADLNFTEKLDSLALNEGDRAKIEAGNAQRIFNF